MNARRSKRGDVVYSIPYSEHSSFTELVNFIRDFRPVHVVPTVSTTTKAVEQQMKLLRLESSIYGQPINPPRVGSSVGTTESSVSVNSSNKDENGETLKEVDLETDHNDFYVSEDILNEYDRHMGVDLGIMDHTCYTGERNPNYNFKFRNLNSTEQQIKKKKQRKSVFG